MMVLKTVVCTGISCTDRRAYISDLCDFSKRRRDGLEIQSVDVGERMIRVGTRHTGLSITERTILDLPESTLKSIRQLAFEEILQERNKSGAQIYIVLTHALFHWKGALIAGWSPERVLDMKPDCFITLWEDVSILWERMNNDPRWVGIEPSEVAVWREEESFITGMMADVVGKPHFLIARDHPVDTLCDLICTNRKKVYRSYPITDVMTDRKIRRQADELRDEMRRYFVLFDPGIVKDAEFAGWVDQCVDSFDTTLNSKRAALKDKLDAACAGLTAPEKDELLESVQLTGEEKNEIIQKVCRDIEDDPANKGDTDDATGNGDKGAAHIGDRLRILRQMVLNLSVPGMRKLALQLDHQTVANDYRLVRQADAVVAFWPERDDGKAPLSFGVICEMFYGLACQKEVHAIWLPTFRPSPFLQSISTRLFENPNPARKFFDSQNISDTIYHRRNAGDD